MEDLDYDIGRDEVSIERLFLDMEELDNVEELLFSDEGVVANTSLEGMSTDKMIRNLQKGRKQFYTQFIAQNKKLYNGYSLWLRKFDAESRQLASSMKEAKSLNSKELGKLVSKKMDGKFINIISLLNGIDPKQIKLAKSRFTGLSSRIKENKEFMTKIKEYADKEFGFNNMLDDKLTPNKVLDLLMEQYESDPNLVKSMMSIKFFGIQRRFRTDKRKLLSEFVNEEGAKTILLDWSGSTMKYLTIQKDGDMKVTYKKLKLTDPSYSDFYQRYHGTITKIVSDTTGFDLLISDMKDTLSIYEKVNISLLKLYNSRDKTYSELKHIRTYHLMLVRVLHLRITELMSTYRLVYNVAKVIDKSIT